jgi:hypothetical protein
MVGGIIPNVTQQKSIARSFEGPNNKTDDRLCHQRFRGV